MIKKTNFLFVVMLLISSVALKAQDMGGNPTGLNWQILNSPSIRVIYPLGMEAKAQRIAGMVNYLDSNNRRSVGTKKRRLDMVLQNQTTNPNGYVALAPFRSEFYATPPSNNLLIGTVDWLDILTIHEYRHALQFMNSLTGLTKLGYYLQGETLWSILNAVSIPDWYFEGDAVIIETALTPSGRGRSPFFTMEQRALAYTNRNYNYLQNRNGSYKNMMPDKYRLGYMMLTKLRNEKGNDITANILKGAASYKDLMYPFSNSLKRETGYSTKKLYEHAWAEKKIDFKNQISEIKPTSTPIIQKNKTTFTNYRFPCILENGDIVARKNSYKSTDEIVLLSNGLEKKITTIGYNNDDYLQHSKGKLVWTETAVNSRRANKTYNNITVYDMNTQKKSYLTKKQRYFSPSISPDGKLIASIFITTEQQNEIHILDISNGDIIEKITTPLNYFLSRVNWSNDGNSIVTIAKHNSKLALIRLNIKNEEILELTDWTSHTLDAPSIKDDKVYFNAGFTGIDNIFYTDLEGSKKIFQITSVPIGAFDPIINNNNEIIFSEFTDMGYIISKQSLISNSENITIKITEPSEMDMYKTIANKSEGGNILDNNYSNNYKSKSYNGLFRGLKLHSWNISPSLSNPGLNITMINLLQDLSINFGSNINRNESNAVSYNSKFVLARYYPQLSLIAQQAKRETEYYSTANNFTSQNFSETKFGAEIAIPLSWIKGNFNTKFLPQIGIYHNNLKEIKAEGESIANNNFSSTQLGFLFSSKRRKAYQNVGTRLGFEVNVNYQADFNTVSSEKMEGNVRLFLPGFFKNHNVTVTAAHQKESLTNLYQYVDVFEYPRGFITPVNDEFKLIKAEYQLPLLYPDKGFVGITYFKRVRANIFYDYGVGENIKLNKSTVYNSAGVEFIFDNTILNLLPISFGVRKSLLLNSDPFLAYNKSGINFFIYTNLLP
jgi:hypothetical protein